MQRDPFSMRPSRRADGRESREESSRDSFAGLLGRERGLRRAADERSTQARDRDLARLFGHVAARRSARYRRLLRNDLDPTGAPASPPRRVEGSTSPSGSVLEIREVGPSVRVLRVARPAGFSFRPGQNVKLTVEGGPSAQPYSIASAPHEPDLQFCLELVAQGRLTPRIFEMRRGDRLLIAPRPRGRFALDPKARLHLMVATVTGIAPFRSMLLSALESDAASFVVVHGASHVEDLPYREELEALAADHPDRLTYIPTVSRPTAPRNRAWSGETGRAEEVAERVVVALGPLANAHAYACGHPGMVDHVAATLSRRGLPVSTEKYD